MKCCRTPTCIGTDTERKGQFVFFPDCIYIGKERSFYFTDIFVVVEQRKTAVYSLRLPDTLIHKGNMETIFQVGKTGRIKINSINLRGCIPAQHTYKLCTLVGVG